MRGLKHMAALVVAQLAAVLDAFVDRNPNKALRVWKADKEVDALYVSLFRELITYSMEDPGTISMCIHHLFCAKNIERMGDHATNIAEAGTIWSKAKPLPASGPKGDVSSYVWASRSNLPEKCWLKSRLTAAHLRWPPPTIRRQPLPKRVSACPTCTRRWRRSSMPPNGPATWIEATRP